jgi:hypothetical protein
MDISVNDKKLREAVQDAGASRRLYGADMAKKLAIRVASLKAAASLAFFWPRSLVLNGVTN